MRPEGLGHVQHLALAQFRLDKHGLHGLPHWNRVHRNGMWIADMDPRVNRRVVAAFAILHDSQREDEYEDLMHGPRGAEYVAQLREQGELDWLSEDELLLLSAACASHCLGYVSDDPTIQACWDADRLDLGRVGIKPEPQYLGSIYARQPGVIERHWDESWGDATL